MASNVMDVEVDVRKMTKTTLTVRVTPIFTTEFKVRKWTAIRLIKLAAMILGCGFEEVIVDAKAKES